MDHRTDTAPAALSRPTALQLIDTGGVVTPIEAELRYEPWDPTRWA